MARQRPTKIAMNDSKSTIPALAFMKGQLPRLYLAAAGAALYFASVSPASAQTNAYDDASAYTVPNGWYNGVNHGFGFGPWTLTNNNGDNGGFAGTYVGNSGTIIDTSFVSLGMYATTPTAATTIILRPIAASAIPSPPDMFFASNSRTGSWPTGSRHPSTRWGSACSMAPAPPPPTTSRRLGTRPGLASISSAARTTITSGTALALRIPAFGSLKADCRSSLPSEPPIPTAWS